jgi:hypothetical protein
MFGTRRVKINAGPGINISKSSTTTTTSTINYASNHVDRTGKPLAIGDFVKVVEKGWGVGEDYVEKIGKIILLENHVVNLHIEFSGEHKMVSSRGVLKVNVEKVKLNKIKLPKINGIQQV